MIRFCNYAFLLLIVALLSSCTVFQAISTINSGQRATSNDVTSTVPFTLSGHLILIKTKLNSSEKEYTFIFDTGALTILRESVANDLHLPPGLEVEAKGSSGSSKPIHLVKLNKLYVGNIGVTDCAAGVLKESDFSELLTNSIDGILGSNFLRFFSVTINFKTKEITLSQRDTPLAPKNYMIEIPIKPDMKNGFAPKIRCIIDKDIKSNAIIDTGTPYTSLSIPTIKKTKAFKEGNGIKANGSMSRGIGSQSKEDYILRIKKFTIGSLELHNIPTRSHSGYEADVLLGNDILSKYTVTIDYPAEKMFLTPNGDSFDKNPLIYPIGFKKQKDKIIVSGLWPGTFIKESGIKVGNEIRTINSIKANNLSLFKLMEICLDKKKNHIDIEFVNETGIQKMTIKKEQLLPVVDQ